MINSKNHNNDFLTHLHTTNFDLLLPKSILHALFCFVKSDHVILLLTILQWLLTAFRLKFKSLSKAPKDLHNFALPYLSDFFSCRINEFSYTGLPTASQMNPVYLYLKSSPLSYFFLSMGHSFPQDLLLTPFLISSDLSSLLIQLSRPSNLKVTLPLLPMTL